MTTVHQQQLKGGEFLIKESNPMETFIPEDFNEEQRMIKEMCAQFIATEVHPVIERLDKLEPGLMESLLDKAGAQGLLGLAYPESLGGLEKDFITNTLVTEALGAGHSFSVAMAAHTGIGALPTLYFGTDAQKQKYIPKLASGEWKAAYALTEPNSGSDALGAKTTAVLSPDGKNYILNGQKCWITNSGFAHLFTVFAKIDGEKFTAFLVEKDAPGLSLGEEEKKMGIKGSSTRMVFFQDCTIPVENLLGEIGKGHIIAFNILNIGRLKLGAAALGGSKLACDTTVSYANTREQFKTPIGQFGAIKHKLAEQAIKIWGLETATYRAAHQVDELEKEFLAAGKNSNEALLGAAEEYAIECAMLKVVGSEVLDFVCDEGVQVHGGNGFSDEYPISRAYRDSRINRIFEGTNEINRLLTLDMMLKRAMKGRIDLMGPAASIQKELMSIPEMSTQEGEFAHEITVIKNLKKAGLMAAGFAAQKLMATLEKEQEILMNLADILIEVYVAESMLLRVMKLTQQKGAANCTLEYDMMRTYLNDACDKINIHGKNAVMSFAEGDELRLLMMGLKRFTKVDAFNTKNARRRIADAMLAANKYPF